MKKFFIKTLDVILTIIMVISALYAIFNLVMTFLPAETQSQVFAWLHMSDEFIATFSISSVINAAVLVSSKLVQTYSRISMTQMLNNQQQTINNDLAVSEQVVNRINSLIDNTKAVQTQLNAVLSMQKVNAERNIEASDKLVNPSQKQAYKLALDTVENAMAAIQELKNITSVYERTEIKEVIVEKETDSLSGRV